MMAILKEVLWFKVKLKKDMIVTNENCTLYTVDYVNSKVGLESGQILIYKPQLFRPFLELVSLREPHGNKVSSAGLVRVCLKLGYIQHIPIKRRNFNLGCL